MSDNRDDRLMRVLEEFGLRLDTFDRHHQRFDRFEKKFEQFQYQMMDALELASMARLQAQSGRERMSIIEDRQRRFEAEVASLCRRVADLEGKLGPTQA